MFPLLLTTLPLLACALPQAPTPCPSTTPAAPSTLASSLTSAASLPPPSTDRLTSILTTVVPASASCEGRNTDGQCADAATAAPAILASFSVFNITSPSEQAAALSTMTFETGSFEFNTNKFPGRPGQGTRNMQMAPFNDLYAKDLFGAESTEYTTARATASVFDPPEALVGDVAVLGLVNGVLSGFPSAAWFIATECAAKEGVKESMQQGEVEGFRRYLVDCVGVGVEEGGEREVLFSGFLSGIGEIGL